MNSEWDKLCIKGQEERLIAKTHRILEELVQLPERVQLNKDINLGQYHNPTGDTGRYIITEFYEQLFLTSQGIHENYFVGMEKKKGWRKFLEEIDNPIRADRLVPKEEYTAMIKKYRVEPSHLEAIKNNMQNTYS